MTAIQAHNGKQKAALGAILLSFAKLRSASLIAFTASLHRSTKGISDDLCSEHSKPSKGQTGSHEQEEDPLLKSMGFKHPVKQFNMVTVY